MTNATLTIKKLKTPTIIGVYEHEKTKSQTLYISLTCTLDISEAAKSDDLTDTLDYDAVCQHIRAFCSSTQVELIETLIVALKKDLEKHFNLINLKLSVDKPNAINDCESVCLTI